METRSPVTGRIPRHSSPAAASRPLHSSALRSLPPVTASIFQIAHQPPLQLRVGQNTSGSANSITSRRPPSGGRTGNCAESEWRRLLSGQKVASAHRNRLRRGQLPAGPPPEAGSARPARPVRNAKPRRRSIPACRPAFRADQGRWSGAPQSARRLRGPDRLPCDSGRNPMPSQSAGNFRWIERRRPRGRSRAHPASGTIGTAHLPGAPAGHLQCVCIRPGMPNCRPASRIQPKPIPNWNGLFAAAGRTASVRSIPPWFPRPLRSLPARTEVDARMPDLPLKPGLTAQATLLAAQNIPDAQTRGGAEDPASEIAPRHFRQRGARRRHRHYFKGPPLSLWPGTKGWSPS